MYAKLLSAISFTRELMNPHYGIDDNNNKDRTKAIAAAIPMAGIVVAAALLSGLSLINGYQPAIAQQNMTGNATTATTNATATTTGGSSSTGAESACTPITGGGGQNATTATTNATTTTTGGGANATTGNATTPTNATTSEAGGGNQSTSEVREHIEAACMAAQNNDTQGVLMNLNLALNELGGNMTTTAGGEDEGEGGEDEGEGGEDEGEGGEDEGEAEG
jgi:hypothetical protein